MYMHTQHNTFEYFDYILQLNLIKYIFYVYNKPFLWHTFSFMIEIKT